MYASVLTRDIMKRVKAYWKFAIGRIKNHDPAKLAFRNMIENGVDGITVRIKKGDAFPIQNVRDSGIDQRGRFPLASFSDVPGMIKTPFVYNGFVKRFARPCVF